MKKIEELQTLSKSELINYFKNYSHKEIDQLLNELGFKTKKTSRTLCIDFAATQINQLGIFERISTRKRMKK